MGKYRFYAVAAGRTTGLFDSWPACAAAVQGYPSPLYKGFTDRQAAEDWLLDEMARRDEARRRKKGQGQKDTGAGGWRCVAATEKLQGPAVPFWPSTWQQNEDSSDTDHNEKC